VRQRGRVLSAVEAELPVRWRWRSTVSRPQPSPAPNRSTQAAPSFLMDSTGDGFSCAAETAAGSSETATATTRHGLARGMVRRRLVSILCHVPGGTTLGTLCFLATVPNSVLTYLNAVLLLALLEYLVRDVGTCESAYPLVPAVANDCHSLRE
jgi:hypothetical protein